MKHWEFSGGWKLFRGELVLNSGLVIQQSQGTLTSFCLIYLDLLRSNAKEKMKILISWTPVS